MEDFDSVAVEDDCGVTGVHGIRGELDFSFMDGPVYWEKVTREIPDRALALDEVCAGENGAVCGEAAAVAKPMCVLLSLIRRDTAGFNGTGRHLMIS